MNDKKSLDDLRRKAHIINCDLNEEGFNPREIEIIGYYIKRIAASYLSYKTHKDYAETENTGKEINSIKTP